MQINYFQSESETENIEEAEPKDESADKSHVSEITESSENADIEIEFQKLFIYSISDKIPESSSAASADPSASADSKSRCIAEIDMINILQGFQNRRSIEKARKHIYFIHLSQIDDLLEVNLIFAIAIQQKHPYSLQLSVSFQFWNNLLKHLHRNDFIIIAEREYSDLIYQEIFKIVPRKKNIKTLLLK